MVNFKIYLDLFLSGGLKRQFLGDVQSLDILKEYYCVYEEFPENSLALAKIHSIGFKV